MDAIEQVREGMDVLSAAGEKVGTIESVKMGDPDAITAEGQSVGQRQGPIMEIVSDVFDFGPDVPQEKAERLLRLGYVRIDPTGLGKDVYRAADQIDRVEGDTVHLKQ